ncbi:hypothetical protein CJU90_2596 [Yarrowia sp. C11]|nr:hypothetical protein CKK34_4044 [Yarrowia sp. E02]KAG5369149.1 hypothetical protein CJU90_2596 [Yarrowia sp. C11]
MSFFTENLDEDSEYGTIDTLDPKREIKLAARHQNWIKFLQRYSECELDLSVISKPKSCPEQFTYLHPPDCWNEFERLLNLEMVRRQPQWHDVGFFKQLMRLCLETTHTESVTISFMDRFEQTVAFSMGKRGFEMALSRKRSLDAHAVLSASNLVLLDTRQDWRTEQHPLVVGKPHILFYAGVPLKTLNGFSIGVLAVYSNIARTSTPKNLARSLSDYADVIMTHVCGQRKAMVNHLHAYHESLQDVLRIPLDSEGTLLKSPVFEEVQYIPPAFLKTLDGLTKPATISRACAMIGERLRGSCVVYVAEVSITTIRKCSPQDYIYKTRVPVPRILSSRMSSPVSTETSVRVVYALDKDTRSHSILDSHILGQALLSDTGICHNNSPTSPLPAQVCVGFRKYHPTVGLAPGSTRCGDSVYVEQKMTGLVLGAICFESRLMFEDVNAFKQVGRALDAKLKE